MTRYCSHIIVFAVSVLGASAAPCAETAWNAQAKSFLSRICYSREQVDDWLSGQTTLFGEVYDSELGWVLADRRYKDGVDGAVSEYRYAGARRMIMYADRTCRVNTYGDSFTHCDQVSDGETWQEVLAAHLCEPVRNYGIGGYSVYQAYLRMLREEPRTPAKYIIFNIYDDDHYRNLPGWRNIRTRYTPQTRPGILSPPLPHVRVNPATGAFEEHPNPCPTRESVYGLCDADRVFELFADDFVLKLEVARDNLRNNTHEKSYGTIRELARAHGIPRDVDSAQSLGQTVGVLDTGAALFASMRIVDKVEEYAASTGKKVLYVLSYSPGNVVHAIRTGERFDQSFVDYLRKKGLPFVDLLQAHIDDHAEFRIDANHYTQRYYVGHYNPRGNFFLALHPERSVGSNAPSQTTAVHD